MAIDGQASDLVGNQQARHDVELELVLYEPP